MFDCNDPLLSILTPSIPERLNTLQKRMSLLTSQHISVQKQVEWLALCDNCRMSIGEKRTRLLKYAKGMFVVFVDDDDVLAPEYFDVILPFIHSRYHSDLQLITYKQHVELRLSTGVWRFTVTFSVNAVDDEQAQLLADGTYRDIVRRPYPACLWRRELVQDVEFPALNYGEDALWVNEALHRFQACGGSSAHIDKTLHSYVYDEKVTRAF